MKKQSAIILVVGLVLLSIGCRFVKTTPPVITTEALLASPEKIEIEGRAYTLETALWRDFMPMSPPDGMPLIAVAKVVAADGQEFPAGLSADRLWVIKDRREVWETDFTSENRGAANKLEKSAGDGPKWGPGIEVDVVVRLITVKEGKTFLLRASKQPITRTD
jgi:hypothetical protein